ncbi:uncharacterized protein LOC120144291 [Hibiscus syriacus]|uniref:uncharacterized protein LOC120144291 n=1 Tax=Hibiscus syriacus TaxID=106335 RepID=UPI0019235860|nr:uncharacterized protein LOC120144291 [Hibiscus syriacus]
MDPSKAPGIDGFHVFFFEFLSYRPMYCALYNSQRGGGVPAQTHSSRVKKLFWLICYKGLLTDEKRVRRHISVNTACALCMAILESISHILRECTTFYSTWKTLIKPCRLTEFLTMNVLEWIRINLLDPNYFPNNGNDWDIMFGSIFWCLLTRRNKFIFESDYVELESVMQRRRRMCDENSRAHAVSAWYKAEYWGVYEGLRIVWEMGMKSVEVESDNREVIELLYVMAEASWSLPFGAKRFAIMPEAVSSVLRDDSDYNIVM